MAAKRRQTKLTPEAVAAATDLDLDVQEVQRMARLAAPFTGMSDDFNRRFEGFLFKVTQVGADKVVEAVGRYDQQQVSRRRRLRSDEAASPEAKELLLMARDCIMDLLEPTTDPAIKENAEWVLAEIERTRR